MLLSSKGKGGNTVAAVWALAEPLAQQLGLTLWDIRFVKEGASWYLRVFVEKEGGVSVDDCVAMSHALDGPLDETDPIEQNYYLEVSSPGLERELTRDEHFQALLGARTVSYTHLDVYKRQSQENWFNILKSWGGFN